MTAPVRTFEFQSEDRVCAQVIVPMSQPAAFERFRHDFHVWWPGEFTWSGDVLEDIFFEGRKGGMIWERGPEGIRFDMARVLRWVPPEKVVLRWHVGPAHMPEPNPEKASEVEFRFVAMGGATRIELEHRHFARHGKAGREYRNAMTVQWPYILKRLADCCGGMAMPLAPAGQGPEPVLRSLPALV